MANEAIERAIARLRQTPETTSPTSNAGDESISGAALRDFAAGVTSPLTIFGLNVEPAKRQTLSGTLAEFVGSLLPYAAVETGLAKVPMLAGAGLGARAARGATSFGLIGAGSGEELDPSRIFADATMGALIGAGTGPGSGLVKSALVGAGASIIPKAFGQDVGSPVPLTGNDVADSALFNGVVAGALSLLGGRVKSSAPLEDAVERTTPIQAKDPGTAIRGLLPSRAAWGVEQAARSEVRAEGHQFEFPFDVPRVFKMGAGEESTIVTPEADRQLTLPFGRDSSVKPMLVTPPTLERPDPTQLELFDPSQYHPAPPPAGVRIVNPRTPEEQAAIERMLEHPDEPTVKTGRVIPLTGDTLAAARALHEAEPDSIPGFDGAGINTTRLKRSELKALADQAMELGDKELARALDRTRAGLSARSRPGLTPGERARLNADQRQRRKLQYERGKTNIEHIADTKGVDAAIAAAEELDNQVEFDGRVMDLEPELAAVMRRPRKSGASLMEQIASRDPGAQAATSYGDIIRSLRSRNIKVLASDESGMRTIVFPDKSTRTMSTEELAQLVRPTIPEQTVAPVYAGSEMAPNETQLTLPLEPTTSGVMSMPEVDPVIAGEGPGAAKAGGREFDPRSVALESPTTPSKVEPKYRTERIYDSLPPLAHFEYVRGLASAKGIDLVIGDGKLITEGIDGVRAEHPNLKAALRFVSESTLGEADAKPADEYRSLLRRRLAASKSAVETTNIKRRYRKYAQFFPISGEGLRNGESPLGSLRGVLDPQKGPVVELTPPGAPPLHIPPGVHPRPPGAGEPPPAWKDVDIDHVNSLGFMSALRQKRNLYLEIEERSKGAVPAFSGVWERLYRATESANLFRDRYRQVLVSAWKRIGKDEDAWFRVGRFMEASDPGAAIREFGIRPKEVEAGKILHRFFDDLWGPEGFNFVDENGKTLKGVDYVKHYLPLLREHPEWSDAQVKSEFVRRRLSTKPVDFFAEHPRGEGRFGEPREYNAFKLAYSYLERGIRKNFLSDDVQKVADSVENLVLPRKLEWIRDEMRMFVKRAEGFPDPSLTKFNDALTSMFRRMGVKLDPQTHQDFTSMLLQMSVAAHIAWRPSLVIRNGFQVGLLYPLLGEKYTGFAIKAMMSKEWANKALKAGVPLNESLPFHDEIYNPFGPATKWIRAGTKAYGSVDNAMRVGAFAGGYQRVLDAAVPFTQGKISLQEFVRRTELTSIFHPVEAKTILELVRGGQLTQAAEKAGAYLQGNTDWIYSSINRPDAFKGVAGRLFGQFGMWPVAYVDYVKYLFKYGTQEERASKIARFMGMNAAIGGLGAVLGVDLWKWLMFGPLVFTGGPFLQMAQDAATVADSISSGRKDEESRLAKTRLARNIPGSLVPGFGAVRDIVQTADVLEEDGLANAIRRLASGSRPKDDEGDNALERALSRLSVSPPR